MKHHHSDDEMLSILFFIPSSLDKEQFDKIIVQLFIAKQLAISSETPFSSETQPGAHSI